VVPFENPPWNIPEVGRADPPSPEFILRDREFMEQFLKKVKGLKGAKLQKTLEALGHNARAGEQHQDEMGFRGRVLPTPGIGLEADFAWHVRAWA